jgi:hypothetical protein
MSGRTMRRIAGSAAVAAALAAAAATPASAMIGPACSTRLAAAEVGTSASCSFDTPYDYAYITVEPAVGTVTATITCFYTWGGTYTSSRTVSSASYWRAYSPGSCSLRLTAQTSLATATGTASPALGPIIDPGPYPG